MVDFKLSIDELANNIGGKIIASNDYYNNCDFSGKFNFLASAKKGDIVIRHKINSKGIEIATSNNAATLITKNPTEDAIEMAKKLNFPLIIVDKIEIANSFALKWVFDNFDFSSKRVAITGTNGKSTTSHMIYHILNSANYHVLTNTDSRSEFNTLIDPMVPKMIYEEIENNGPLDYCVIEVSEVQGWLDSVMKDHAYLMTNAINPDVGIITNVTMDHIGLVNTIEDVLRETSGLARGLKKGTLVLNKDDINVSQIEPNEGVKNLFFSMDSKNASGNVVFDEDKKLVLGDGEEILTLDDLPFKTNHFIQNTLAAIGACLALEIPLDDIVNGVKTYKSLKRRFAKLNDNPTIYDDFAHNPDGIKSTVYAGFKLLSDKGNLWIINAIRGSRGETLNKLNAESLVEVINKISKEDNSSVNLILSSSEDVVDNLNTVTESERELFCKVLDNNNIIYTHFNCLNDALKTTLAKSDKDDILLLIGAQGMDPAEDLLNDIL
ncbi:Mur ligase family protein [uncultured Methanobrevibacter sp.]|uniref:Mur ligase family protein n=1 Tax=uncultured Methanobrevibacter sp. TaxID=253161 RepID=UPI0025E5F1EA|nr:Mur ligase family protein [uncultured Methanobrevibacter sp.]